MVSVTDCLLNNLSLFSDFDTLWISLLAACLSVCLSVPLSVSLSLSLSLPLRLCLPLVVDPLLPFPVFVLVLRINLPLSVFNAACLSLSFHFTYQQIPDLPILVKLNMILMMIFKSSLITVLGKDLDLFWWQPNAVKQVIY